MTKLSGTSGQLFSGLAESLTIRGTSRSAKGAGTKSPADSSFNDLLHTVSNLAKRALNDEGSDTAVKGGTLRTRLVHPAETDKDETVHERTAAAAESKAAGTSEDKSTDKSSDKKADKSGKHGPASLAAKPDVQNQPGTPVIVGQEIAAAFAVKPQTQAAASDRKDAPARDERASATKRDVQATGMAKATAVDAASSTAAPIGGRSQGAAPQMAAALQTALAQDSEPSSTAMPPAAGFEAVTANVERAAKAAGREALPEATKVTVVQQETHLAPAQFNAPQQIASAIVGELKESAAPTASAAPDFATSQGNAPDQPLKILTINLEPPALGNVTVRLRLVGTEVSVHLAAERKDTSQMLDQQRDSIRDLMQSAGYVADVAPVQHGSLDGFQSGSGQPQPQPSGQQQTSSQSQGTFDGAGNSSRQPDGGASQERQSNQETRHDQDVGPQTRRGPVYL